MRCVLVSCCGLPAAGKTTFCRSLANCTASDTTTTTTTTSSSTEAVLLAPSGGAMTTTTSSTKQYPHNSLRDRSVFRVRHVCFDEHIDQARRRRRCHLPPSRQSFSKPRTRHTGEGEACEEDTQGNSDKRHEDRDKNASIQSGADSDTNTNTAGLEADAMQHAGDSAEGEEDTARWWHEGRRNAMAEVEALLTAARSREDNSPPSPGQAAEAGAVASAEGRKSYHDEETMTDVVIADDNMHFRSMRHEVLCLARKYGCGFAQVYFPTDTEVAVERNRGRAAPVDEAVIRKMAENIQPPDPERFKWEQHTSVIEPSGFRQNVAGVLEGDKDADVLRHRWASSSSSGAGIESGEDGSALRSFWRVIAAAAEAPVPPLPVSATILREQESDRATTKASFLHQLDLELRESVKRVAVKAAEASLTRENLRTVLGACSVSRKTCLRRAKGGHWSQQGNVASVEDMVYHQKKIDCCVEGSSSSNSSSCAPSEEWDGKVAPLSLTPMQEFCFEFEGALSGFSWLGSSVRRELVEAARGAACTKL